MGSERVKQNYANEPQKRVILLLVYNDCDAFTFFYILYNVCHPEVFNTYINIQ